MFSSRLPDRLAPNSFTRTLAALRQSGATLLDLTETNPTVVGIAYPPDVLDALADARARRYEPHPLGLTEAREAVAADYARRGAPASADRVVLTSSTSEAYSLLFKLLANPGDEVLVPEPSYPLFDLLTRLDGVPARPYRLVYDGSWSIDRASFDEALTPRARAVLVVCPNNPTGSMMRRADREWLVGRAAERGLAIVADEVFADYPLAPKADACLMAGEDRVLTFSLGGLSKSAGLPQVKLGWMRVDGPRERVVEALQRLEVVCDSYLSVSTPVQVAAARLIEAGRSVRAGITARITVNLRCIQRGVAEHPAVTLLMPEGGWSAVLRVPAVEPEDALVTRLLEDAHVVAHPGYFFDFAHGAFVVVSLLPEPSVLSGALERMWPILAGARS